MNTEENKDRELALDEWLDGRPDIIKEMARKAPPWFKYRIKKTGQHCYLRSYSEDGTVTVEVCGHDSEFLDIINESMPIDVFGICIDDIERMDCESSENKKAGS